MVNRSAKVAQSTQGQIVQYVRFNIFDEKLPLKFDKDASQHGIGEVISGILPSGEERPIAYASCTADGSESQTR